MNNNEMSTVFRMLNEVLVEAERCVEKVFDAAWEENMENDTPPTSLSRLCTSTLPMAVQDIETIKGSLGGLEQIFKLSEEAQRVAFKLSDDAIEALRND